MPGFLLHFGATVQCTHGAQATAGSPNPKVLVKGQPVVTVPGPFAIAGCPFNISGSPSPCVSVTWTTAATKVLVGAMPVLLISSQSICAPNGTPLIIVKTETCVIGS